MSFWSQNQNMFTKLKKFCKTMKRGGLLFSGLMLFPVVEGVVGNRRRFCCQQDQYAAASSVKESQVRGAMTDAFCRVRKGTASPNGLCS